MSESITARLGDKEIIIETGKLAKQADGAVAGKYKDDPDLEDIVEEAYRQRG